MAVEWEDLVQGTRGQVLSQANPERPLGRISTDSRTLEKGDVFFALKGVRFNGHDFIRDAYEKGARTFVVSDVESFATSNFDEASFLRVPDTLKAYGDLAKEHRKRFNIPAIAITGSSGKTTVKELVAHVLSTRFRVLKNKGTENNLIGVPKTLFGLDASHELIVLEMGTSQPGEIERLSSIIGPQIGVVTQIGLAHLEGLKSQEGIKTEKLSLLQNLERGGVLVLSGEDPNLADVQSGVHRVVRVGFSKEQSDFVAEQTWCHEAGSSFQLEGKLFETALLGRHNVLNALFALVVADVLGLTEAEVKKALATFRPVAGRLAFKEIEGIHFLDDTYNSNPNSFRAALEFLKDLKIRERKAVVCGQMLELGQEQEYWHRQIGALIAETSLDYVIAAGPSTQALIDEATKQGFPSTKIFYVPNSQEAGKLCRKMAQPGDRILIKGSRATAMEKVLECFTSFSTR